MKKVEKILAAIAHAKERYPGAKVGILGSVGGSWSRRWRCDQCGGSDRILVTQHDGKLLDKICVGCVAGTQLGLPLESTGGPL